MICGIVFFAWPFAKAAIAAGSVLFSNDDSSISCPDKPKISLSAAPNVTLVPGRRLDDLLAPPCQVAQLPVRVLRNKARVSIELIASGCRGMVSSGKLSKAYIPSRPDETKGESTAWYASFQCFAAAYLETRFRKELSTPSPAGLRMMAREPRWPFQAHRTPVVVVNQQGHAKCPH